MRIAILILLAAVAAFAQPYYIPQTGITRAQLRGAWNIINSNTAWFADNIGGEGGGVQTNISYTAVTNAPWQWGDSDLTNWAAIATSAKQDALGFTPQIASANLTNWSATATSVKEDAITSGTTAQFWRGDKSWQALDKSAVGLSSVDNVADASKPVSSAQESRIVGATNGIVSSYNAADTVVSNGLNARIIATNDLLVTRITAATNDANTVELARIVSATNNIDAAKITVGNLSVNRLNSGTSASGSTFWRGDGTWAAAGGGSSYLTKLEMTTNFVNAHAVANTLTNIPQLSFAVVSGTTYKIRALIYFTTAATTTGSRWTITGPAMTACGLRSEYTLTATTTTRNAMLQATNLPAAANLTSAAGVNMAEITGIFRPSANGTVSVAFASEVLSSAVTAQAGSTLEYW